MSKDRLPKSRVKEKKGGRFLPVLFRILGTLILIVVILVCLPLAAPRLMGYQAFAVVSGSMAPEIPMGSIVYVQEKAPEDIAEGEVIAFYRYANVIVHRVAANHLVPGTFTTKGDANQSEDIDDVRYDAVIGVVQHHFPELGNLYLIFSERIGKIWLAVLASCGVMFHMLAGQISYRRKMEEAE